MKAVRVARLDGPSAVELVDIELPERRPDEVLIEVVAAGVSFPDVLQTRGQYQIKPQLPFIAGGELAGIVREAPPSARVRPGDRVCALVGVGAFAEFASVNPALVFPIPDEVSFAAGAALPMNYLTVHFALTRRGGLQSGETVLVHGAAGGIGTAATQMATALGARVIAVVSTEAKADAARAAGAAEVVPADSFLAEAKALTNGRGVDIVIDPVGGERFLDSLRSLGSEGRLLVIGFTGGEIPTVKVNRLLLNNIAVVGVGWGAFWVGRVDYLQQQWDALEPLLVSGKISPVLGASYPLSEAGRAISDLEDRRAIGKVILNTSESTQ